MSVGVLVLVKFCHERVLGEDSKKSPERVCIESTQVVNNAKVINNIELGERGMHV